MQATEQRYREQRVSGGDPVSWELPAAGPVAGPGSKFRIKQRNTNFLSLGPVPPPRMESAVIAALRCRYTHRCVCTALNETRARGLRGQAQGQKRMMEKAAGLGRKGRCRPLRFAVPEKSAESKARSSPKQPPGGKWPDYGQCWCARCPQGWVWSATS